MRSIKAASEVCGGDKGALGCKAPRTADCPPAPHGTMFIGNLPDQATETELRAMMAAHAGFQDLSFTAAGTPGSANSGRKPVCFVLFDSVQSCSAALNAVGPFGSTTLPSDPAHPLIFNYAKKSMRTNSQWFTSAQSGIPAVPATELAAVPRARPQKRARGHEWMDER
eukprot:gene49362-54128_t